MNNLLGSRICGGNTSYKRNASDFYPTPPEVTNALLDFLRIPYDTKIWEPACGRGDMTKVLIERGYKVIGTDIDDGIDYLNADIPDGIRFIITNPPFSLSEQFIKRSIYHNVPFAFLLKSQYWNAKKRYDLFKKYPPSFVLPLTWRPDFLFKTRGNGSPLMDVMWCVWDQNRTFGETRFIPLLKPMEGNIHNEDGSSGRQ